VADEQGRTLADLEDLELGGVTEVLVDLAVAFGGHRHQHLHVGIDAVVAFVAASAATLAACWAWRSASTLSW
jgi:uncharacterized RDD family membrane protein YckC